jgi:hypothetical protein
MGKVTYGVDHVVHGKECEGATGGKWVHCPRPSETGAQGTALQGPTRLPLFKCSPSTLLLDGDKVVPPSLTLPGDARYGVLSARGVVRIFQRPGVLDHDGISIRELGPTKARTIR